MYIYSTLVFFAQSRSREAHQRTSISGLLRQITTTTTEHTSRRTCVHFTCDMKMQKTHKHNKYAILDIMFSGWVCLCVFILLMCVCAIRRMFMDKDVRISLCMRVFGGSSLINVGLHFPPFRRHKPYTARSIDAHLTYVCARCLTLGSCGAHIRHIHRTWTFWALIRFYA